MKKKISFLNMPHSGPLEEHTSTKLDKISSFIDDSLRPLHVEVWLKANKQHPHHWAEIHLKTPHFDINAHSEGVDMYTTVDNTIDKVVTLLLKEKEKRQDKDRKNVDTEKRKFV